MGWLKYTGEREAFVYALVDPRDEQIRYVGRTVSSVESRRKGHVREAKKKPSTAVNYRRAWIRQLLDEDLEPSVVVLERGVWSCDTLNDKEKEWIARLSDSCSLTNATRGGDGGFNEGLLAYNKRIWTDQERALWAQRSREQAEQRRATRPPRAPRSVMTPDELREHRRQTQLARYADPDEHIRTGEAVRAGLTQDGKKRIGLASMARHGYSSPIEETLCASCGEPFMPTRRGKQTCSTTCWRKLVGARKSASARKVVS